LGFILGFILGFNLGFNLGLFNWGLFDLGSERSQAVAATTPNYVSPHRCLKWGHGHVIEK